MHSYRGELRSQKENVAWRDLGRGMMTAPKLSCQKSDPCNLVPGPVFLEREGMRGAVSSPFPCLTRGAAPCKGAAC